MSSTDTVSPTEHAAYLISKGYTPDEVIAIMKREGIMYPTIAGVINEFLGQKNMTVDTLAGRSGIDPSTIFRIMSKQRNPSRNVLIRMALALGLTLEETQVLLKSGNCAALSAGSPRDLILMDGIINKKYYTDLNEILVQKGFVDLDSRG